LTMLRGDDDRKADVMATALRHLPQQDPPSRSVVPGLMAGLENVNILTRRALGLKKRPSLARKRA